MADKIVKDGLSVRQIEEETKEKQEYTRKNNKINNKLVPYWLEHPEVCKSKPASPEEQAHMEKLLSKFKED